MSTELTPHGGPLRRGLARRNSMAFPSKLRDAIPPLHDGRVLELDSINGQASNTHLFGPVVQLKLIVKETGKLTDSFVILMGLQPGAARELSATLAAMANQAEQQQPI